MNKRRQNVESIRKKTVSKDGKKAKKRKRKRDKDNTPETKNRKIDTKEGEQVY